jgi:type VI secretion system protein ImpK
LSAYVVTALDEAANSTKWGGGTEKGEVGPWASGMLAQFRHGDIDGGRKFFLLVGRLMTAQPEQHRDLLEVLYHILSLGFQGQYRTDPDGQQYLATIRKRLDALITAGREPVPLALSPHLQGVPPDRFQVLRSIPVWVSATFMALGVLGTFGYYKYQLSILRGQVVANIVAIGNMTVTAPPTASSPTKQ